MRYFYPRPPGGGRHTEWQPQMLLSDISIHALRVEGDCRSRRTLPTVLQFLSTPSGWRATGFVVACLYRYADFYPRPPGGGRPSISFPQFLQNMIFLSTPSGWRATKTPAHLQCPERISIHALRVEGDVRVYETVTTDSEISIHALRVEGDISGVNVDKKQQRFLSTPSGWRATHVEDRAG